MSIKVRATRDHDMPNSNAARVRCSEGEHLVKEGKEFSLDAKRIYVIRLNPRVKVTVSNQSSKDWSTELSDPGEPVLDDILGAGKSISLPKYASMELRK